MLIQKNKQLYLSGGGNEKDSLLLDRVFVGDIFKNGRSILYIPVAMDPFVNNYEECFSWFTDSMSLAGGGALDVTMWTDLLHNKNINLKNFDAIYFGGGNTYRLLNILYESNFILNIKKYISDGGLLYGGSAGAIIMGLNVDTVLKENDNDYKYNKGLSVIGDYSIICHYQECLDPQIWDFIEKYNTPVIAIPERGGLKIKDNVAWVIGYDSVVIFFPNKKITLGVGRYLLI